MDNEIIKLENDVLKLRYRITELENFVKAKQTENQEENQEEKPKVYRLRPRYDVFSHLEYNGYNIPIWAVDNLLYRLPAYVTDYEDVKDSLTAEVFNIYYEPIETECSANKQDEGPKRYRLRPFPDIFWRRDARLQMVVIPHDVRTEMDILPDEVNSIADTGGRMSEERFHDYYELTADNRDKRIRELEVELQQACDDRDVARQLLNDSRHTCETLRQCVKDLETELSRTTKQRDAWSARAMAQERRAEAATEKLGR